MSPISLFRRGDSVRMLAGVVAINAKTSKLLMLTSRNENPQWILEEAGLSGKIVKELGHWTEDKPNKKHNTDSNDIIYYEMDVTDVDSGFLEKSERELKWVSYKEAIDLASNDIVREAIEKSSLSSDIAKL
ncbi:hypothetical protein IWQ60_008659 [Tieghemiomyces parasiticus]|uniref:Nudix hydrolase domain-containing protein n=1 Tax=Tieghemiomyces parasiticus TaxID=78921 RepID=A0A9W7ZS03_9FUNG|nr:hypothetical protein IWQ60_008659 [Tieghemiomyces parasiticus]